EEILALFADHAPFGGNVVGLDAAAWRYYRRPSNRLSWSESATLAVL
ncbi:MAG: transglycosylase domain-containing protein, partial [Bacteroidetes bacterium]|nr:transglycosylase domain-containing protein [Bacteroidota bacterium]